MSEWLDAHARVVWVAHHEPLILEEQLIRDLSLFLNLQGNEHHPFHEHLSALRARAKRRAEELPVL